MRVQGDVKQNTKTAMGARPMGARFPKPSSLSGSLFSLLALGAMVPTPWSQTITQVHPAYTLTSLRPTGYNPQVAGLDFLPDGRMVLVHLKGFGKEIGEVHILSGVQNGVASQVTSKVFATGLNEPLGLEVVDGKIYVTERSGVTLLEDKDGDGVAETKTKVGPSWKYSSDNKVSGGAVNGGQFDLEFALDLTYKDGKFYTGLATAWPLDKAQSKERGCVLSFAPNATAFDTVACGMRTPNGQVIGPENELFVTENQGNWVPGSKLLHIKKGRFFGVHKPASAGVGPYDKEPETPPVVWLLHGTAGVSPTQPVYLKTGPFAGQMVFGDNCLGTMQRVFLEKVKGEYQGAAFIFSGGLEAGSNRIVIGPDSALYVGQLGFSGSLWGGWNWSGKLSGLQRMALSGKSQFDWLAVRSTGADKLELEFTEAVSAAAESPSAYAVQQWNYTPKAEYGQAKGTNQALTVQSVALSADRKKVTLTVPNMTVRNVINIRISGVTSQAGGAQSWSRESWYTLNAVGPADPPVALAPEAKTSSRQKLTSKLRFDRGGFIVPGLSGQGAVHPSAGHDVTGRLRESATAR